jgi:hypothetical protein
VAQGRKSLRVPDAFREGRATRCRSHAAAERRCPRLGGRTSRRVRESGAFQPRFQTPLWDLTSTLRSEFSLRSRDPRANIPAARLIRYRHSRR